MRLLAVASLVAVLGCQSETSGLDVHVVVPETALTAVERVTITIENPAGSMGTLAQDLTEHQITAHTESGKVVLTIPRAFPISAAFDLLAIPSGGSSLSVRLSGQLLDAAGKLRATAPATAATLAPGKRTKATLTFTCGNSDCSPVASGAVVDLAGATTGLMTTTGAADGDQLTLLGVGHFSTAGGDLVAAAVAKGTVYIFHGRDWSLPGHQAAVTAAGADVTITTGVASQSLGDAVAIGDFDGDGLDDLVVTSINAQNGSLSGAGAAYVISGTRLGAPAALDLSATPADVTIYGGAGQESLGSAAALAHIHAATAMDLVVGAVGATGAAGAAHAGRVYVVFGGASHPAVIVAGDPGVGAQDATILGAIASAPIGFALAAGDLDGDGHADVAVGNYVEGQKGSVQVVAGAALTHGAALTLGSVAASARITGNTSSQLGWAVAMADVDGNGTLELVVGARQTGVVYLFDLPALTGQTLDVGAGQFDLALTGPAGSSFGAALARGDVDGDALDDLIIGAPGGAGPDGTRTGAGACFVMTGSGLGAVTAGGHRTIALATTPAALTVHGAAKNDKLGEHVALGNVDVSDTLDEILAGSLPAANARGVIYAIQNLPQ